MEAPPQIIVIGYTWLIDAESGGSAPYHCVIMHPGFTPQWVYLTHLMVYLTDLEVYLTHLMVYLTYHEVYLTDLEVYLTDLEVYLTHLAEF